MKLQLQTTLRVACASALLLGFAACAQEHPQKNPKPNYQGPTKGSAYKDWGVLTKHSALDHCQQGNVTHDHDTNERVARLTPANKHILKRLNELESAERVLIVGTWRAGVESGCDYVVVTAARGLDEKPAAKKSAAKKPASAPEKKSGAAPAIEKKAPASKAPEDKAPAAPAEKPAAEKPAAE